jgi:hypothetical protein
MASSSATASNPRFAHLSRRLVALLVVDELKSALPPG